MQQLFIDLLDHAWTLWLALAIVCGILELVIPSFSFIFGCVPALITALISIQWGLTPQLVVFSVLLLSSLALIRPRLVAKLHSSKSLPTRTEALLGKKGIVTEAIHGLTGTGRVLVEGQDWLAQSTQNIAVEKTVLVEGSDGIVLKVKEV